MSHTQKINRLPSAVAMAAALALSATCGAALAEATKSTATIKQTTSSMAPQVASMRDARASKVIGRDVRDVQGKPIGEVHELIVDVGSGRIQYVVLSFGGVMGVGDKLFAFPAASFRNPHSSGDLVLEVAKASLQKAPGFERMKWPDFGDKTYRESIDRYFSVASPTSTAPALGLNQRLVRVSKLIGKDINDKAGKDAGEIKDVVVDLGASKVRYVVVDFDKAWSPDDKLLAMPLAALTFPTKTDDDLVLNVPRDQLELAKGFDEKSWPDINSATWREDIDRYIDKFPSAAGQTPSRTPGDMPAYTPAK